jgi:hypothetical protein
MFAAQHVPSTQNVDWHCSPALHGVPLPLAPPHVPVLQNCPSGQTSVLQQKPSTQKPERHCTGSEHGAPFSPGPSSHWPVVQS